MSSPLIRTCLTPSGYAAGANRDTLFLKVLQIEHHKVRPIALGDEASVFSPRRLAGNPVIWATPSSTVNLFPLPTNWWKNRGAHPKHPGDQASSFKGPTLDKDTPSEMTPLRGCLKIWLRSLSRLIFPIISTPNMSSPSSLRTSSRASKGPV